MLRCMNVQSVCSRSLARAQRAGFVRACLSVLLALAATTAVAVEPCQPFEGGRVDAQLLEVMRSAAREGRLYRVVPGNSRVGFCVRHFLAQEFRGEFSNLVGGLAMPDAEHPYGQALLLVHTTPLEVNEENLAPLVTGHEFMDTGRYPEILFVGRKFEWMAPQQGYLYGELTLRGKTRPLVFAVSVDVIEKGQGELPERIFLKGTGQVNRYQFDMRSHRFTVSETVRLCLSVDMVPWGH
jgi:polyisoprenoid-binding protein YceI